MHNRLAAMEGETELKVQEAEERLTAALRRGAEDARQQSQRMHELQNPVALRRDASCGAVWLSKGAESESSLNGSVAVRLENAEDEPLLVDTPRPGVKVCGKAVSPNILDSPSGARHSLCDAEACSSPALCFSLQTSRVIDEQREEGRRVGEFRWREEFSSLLLALEADQPSCLVDTFGPAGEASSGGVGSRGVRCDEAPRSPVMRSTPRARPLTPKVRSASTPSLRQKSAVVPFSIVRRALLNVPPLTEDDVFVGNMHRKLDAELAERREFIEKFRCRVRGEPTGICMQRQKMMRDTVTQRKKSSMTSFYM